MAATKRRIVQVACSLIHVGTKANGEGGQQPATQHMLFAVSDDGLLFESVDTPKGKGWNQLPELPDSDVLAMRKPRG